MRRLLLLLLCFCLPQLLPAQSTAARPASTALFPYQRGELWGYADSAGRVVIGPVYQHAEPFRQGLAQVWRAGKCGYVDARGREVVPLRWDAASYQEPPTSRLNRILGASVTAWANAQRWVVVMRYDSLDLPADFRATHPQPWAAAVYGGTSDAWQIGFYTAGGQLVLPPRYTGFRALSPDYYAARLITGRYSGREVTGCSINYYRDRPEYADQLVHRSGRQLLADRRLYTIDGLHGDQLLVGGRGQYPLWQLLDTTGRVIIGPAPGSRTGYSDLHPLTPDRRHWAGALWRDRRFAQGPPPTYLLRPDGSLVVPWLFADLQPLPGGRAVASRWRLSQRVGTGLLDLDEGCWLISPQYQSLEPSGDVFVAGYWSAPGCPTAYGVIDSLGHAVIAPRYDGLTRCRTTAGQVLPVWYAETSHGIVLLNLQGQELLKLPRRQEFLPVTFDANLQIRLWDARPRRVRILTIQLFPDGPRALLTRPRKE